MASDIVRFARTLSREEFVQRFVGMYLVLSFDQRELPGASFQTAVTGRPKDRGDGGAKALQVVAIAKAPGNPYADRISVGRTANCDIVLRDPSVSKLHAHFRFERDELVVVDQRSSNGTLVNGTTILPGMVEPLEQGDVVQFGEVRATVLRADGVYEALQRLF